MAYGGSADIFPQGVGLLIALLAAPSGDALRTSVTLAGIVIGTLVLVGVWWYLVVRGRDKD